MGFSNVRAETRALESECDQYLTQLSDLVQNPADSSALEAQIEHNLTARAAQVQELFTAAYEPQAAPTWLHQAQRHAELLDDHRNATKRLRSAVSQERSRKTLLSSVRDDIQSHRSGAAASQARASAAEGSSDAGAYYSDEQSRVNQSHSVADTLLASAYEARAELMNQQNTLRDVQRRLFRAASQIPGINTLISKINTRQKRNSLILAMIIVFGVLFIVFVR